MAKRLPAKSLLPLIAALLLFVSFVAWKTSRRPTFASETFVVAFVWDNGIKNLDALSEDGKPYMRNPKLREVGLREAAPTVTRWMHGRGLHKAKGSLSVSIFGFEEPYMVHFGNWTITEPNVDLFIQAGAYGKVEIIREFLAQDMDVDARDIGGRTALMHAAAYPDPEGAKILLAAGADLNAQDDLGGTALMMASHLGNVRVVEVLLAAGADPDIRDSLDHTALTEAESRGHSQIVALLKKATRQAPQTGLRD